MSLYEQFKKIKRNYYLEDDANVKDDFSMSKNALTRFFYLGEKESVLDSFDEIDDLRANHSMSLLYFGIYINQKMNLNMEIKISNQSFDFNYIWSILCFYHDLGYAAETTNSFIFKINEKNRHPKYRNINVNKYYLNMICHDFCLLFKSSHFYSKSICMLAYRLNTFSVAGARTRTRFNDYSHNDYIRIDQVETVEVKYCNKNIKLKKTFFTEKEILNYYNYRLSEFGVYDHGIVGGYIFFDSIMKCYIDSYKSRDGGTISSFDKNFRYYCIEQIPLFAYLSDCIVSHNIFFPAEDDEELYKHYELMSINDKKKISMKNNPVLFLLDLLDTIDPIKYFTFRIKNITIRQILKSFNWIINEFSIVISLSKDSFISIEQYKAYVGNILSIAEWLNVEISYENCKIKILILQ